MEKISEMKEEDTHSCGGVGLDSTESSAAIKKEFFFEDFDLKPDIYLMEEKIVKTELPQSCVSDLNQVVTMWTTYKLFRFQFKGYFC